MMIARRFLRLTGLLALLLAAPVRAQLSAPATDSAGAFPLFANGVVAELWVDAADYPGVRRAAADLRADIARVTARTPVLHVGGAPTATPPPILVGTLGHSPLLDRLAAAGQLEVAAVTGRWESYLIQVVEHPAPGIPRALVIAGSDKRGAVYGIYELSQALGVSPWYWWADVPVNHRDAVYVPAGVRVQGPPSVKYRGLFLNDESPDLTGWVREKFGTIPTPGGGATANYGRQFYTNLFELILRLRGNYLWPAMWNNRFNEDDPENPRLADEYGVVMGTSHQEPMLRAQKEWDLGTNYGRVHRMWNYGNTNQRPVLQNFWREGVRRNKDFESIFTLGLRAENDSGAPIGRALTEEIVGVQRQILASEIGPDLGRIPQMWCLYKEVQDYYQEGLRPPEDITLLWAEDNWGNVRRLPTAAERLRPGGAGIYYHFDYHGGPRNYQWINTSPIARVWDQMALAKQYGADRIWIVNVGHLKGCEFPLEFFLALAWDTERWSGGNLREFTRQWAARQFTPALAGAIAEVLTETHRFNGRRKPELLEAGTYSLTNYHEAERVGAEFQALADRSAALLERLPPAQHDAYYQLVHFPALAGAGLNAMYLAANQNAVFARQGRASANAKAAECRALFQAETNLMAEFNHSFAGGKWNHFMDQPFIGYTGWDFRARDNNLGAVPLRELIVPEAAELGVVPEGPGTNLPPFDSFNRQTRYVELFNRGRAPAEFTATADAPWLKISATSGVLTNDLRLRLTVDWSRAPRETAAGTIAIRGTGTNYSFGVSLRHPSAPTRDSVQGFVEDAGVVAIEPEHHTANTLAGGARWRKIEDYGRTLSGMRAETPVDAPPLIPGTNAPCLEYKMFLFSAGETEVTTVTSPALNFLPGRPVRLAVAFDDAPPQTLTVVPAAYTAQNGNRDWENSVRDNARQIMSRHVLAQPGYHTLKIWAIDPGVVVQRILVDLGGLRPSHLGPPESFFHGSPDQM